MEKKELRREMKRRNFLLAAPERAAASQRILRRVESLSAFAEARVIALFAALGDEPDTAEMLARWGASKRLVLPRVEGGTMRFFRYDPATMAAGAFGISEPGPNAVHCAVSEIDLILVPGVAFTPAGARLGRGRGYYDRYLAQADFHALKVGVCYAHQQVAELPTEPHDIRLDAVITG